MTPTTHQIALQGSQSPLLLVCHLVMVLLAFALIAFLSGYERRLVSRRLGIGLLCLRISVLVVILLTLLQPTISWTFKESRVGRILVGIDLSESMSTIDRHASRAEKLRVARGLELIGNDALDERLNRWQRAFDSDQLPQWVEADEKADDKRRAALEESRRDHLEAIFRELEKLPRREIARRLLSTTQRPILDQLGQSGHVELFVFAGKAESIEPEKLSTIITEPYSHLNPETTDLSLGLQWKGNGADEIMGIVILTDGRDHSGRNLPALAAALKTNHVPVYPVLIGSRFQPKDLAVLLLEHPQTVYRGDHPLLKVTLGCVGFDGKTIEVELLREDRPKCRTDSTVSRLQRASAVAEFELDADETGRRSYLVKIPFRDGETRDDNNTRAFTLNVVDDRAKVFVIDGEARWEFRYLDAALGRDERIDLKTVLFDQPHLGVLPEPFFPNRLVLPTDPSDLAASPFAECDLVILGDVSPEQFTETACQLLLKFVSSGGTLVLSSGPRNMPLEHRSPAFEQLLPVKNLSPVSLGDSSQEAAPSLRDFRSR